MTFRNVLLPTGCDLSWDSAAGFDTALVRTDNGAEKRNANWDGTLARATIKYTARTKAVWTELDEHFQIMRGRAYSFPVRDPRKNVAASGEGVFIDGQAYLAIVRGGYTTYKRITKLDATAVISGGTVDILTGISSNGATAWTGKFYLCMRYDTDALDVTGINKSVSTGLIAGFGDVPLVEVPFE